MGVCRYCNYYVMGICPSGNPWRVRCVFNTDDEEETKTMANDTAVLVRKKDQAIYNDYKAGMSTKELATKYNVHTATIRRSLNLQGVDLKADKEMDRELEKKIIKDAKDNGLSYQEIANKYGITKYRVKELKRKYGLLESQKSKIEKVVEKKPVEEPKEESMSDLVTSSPGTTFIFRAGGKKPYKNCYPVEKDEYLAWGLTIHSIDDLLELVDSLPDGGSLEIHKRELDIVYHRGEEDSHANNQ